MNPQQPQQLDQDVVRMAKAIREAESGNRPVTPQEGAGFGGASRYQYSHDTWKGVAQKYLGDANAPLSLENENKATYLRIKDWKDQGYNLGQVASMWNAGEGRPNAYRENHKGVNQYGVAYDTPSYAEKVAQNYQKLKGQGGGHYVPQGQDQPIPGMGGESVTPTEPQSFTEKLGQTGATFGTKLSGAIGDTFRGPNDPKDINAISGLIRGAGAVGGLIGDLTDNVLSSTPIVKEVYNPAMDAIGKGVGAAMNTEGGQKLTAQYQQFAEAHPELAGDISAGIDAATAIPLLKGFKAVKGGVMNKVDNVLRGKTDDVLEMVSEPLTPKNMANAVANRGVETKGLLKNVSVAPDPFEVKVADAVRANVKGFDPGKSLLHNIGATKTTVSTMSKKLKTEVKKAAGDSIYSYREFGNALNSIEMPVMIASDVTLSNAYNRVIAKAVEIAKKKKGKVENLLDVRQDFDRFINQQFPNLYSNQNLTPMRQAIKDVRNAITDFTVKSLPNDPGLKQSLFTQHLLLEAVENMAKRATKGSTKEVGTDALTRWEKGNPRKAGLIKAGGGAALNAAGVGGMIKILQ